MYQQGTKGTRKKKKKNNSKMEKQSLSPAPQWNQNLLFTKCHLNTPMWLSLDI